MSWKPMDTAPKDGTVIVVYADFTELELIPDVFHAYYEESKGHWDLIDESLSIQRDLIRTRTPLLLGWIEVPDSSRLAGKRAYRDEEPAREPGKLHIR